ncbi:NEW3 domain-containing protein, partial [Kitasatospora herbaricolor]
VGVTATTAAADWARYGWLDVDSNLPDFRIVLGGPEQNDVARELLDRAGAGHAAELARRGRVWVPAEKPLAEVWQPNADLRDLRALPALIVLDGELEALVDDFADARVSAGCPGAVQAGELLTDRTVALLTYGLPGFAVDPSGALHLSLLRSCTGWPSGIWIDPPRRTAPDGSSFQLQHWTHDFHYALVSGEGDWRELRLPSQGQEFNHPLYARLLDPQPGPLPPTRSYLRVHPAREVLLGALKPAGNPVAHGSADHPDPAAGVTVRLLESTGLGRTARLDGALRLRRLQPADLLERPTGGPLEEATAARGVPLAGSAVATLLGVPVPAGPSGAREDGEPSAPSPLGPTAEVAQPVHARYWLHNRGPAPMGYLPVSVGVSPGLLRTDGEPVEISVVLASQLRDAETEGTAAVLAPEGWRVSTGRRPYRLLPGGHLRFPVTLTPPAGVEPGLYFAAARIEYGGQSVEDVATLAVGDQPALHREPDEGFWQRDVTHGTTAAGGRDTGLSVDSLTTAVRVAPGGRAELGVVLTNRTRGEIRGELQVVSPWGTWDAIHEPVRGFTLLPGATRTVRFEVAPPPDAEPARAWALTKVMWFGRCQYAPTVELVVT